MVVEIPDENCESGKPFTPRRCSSSESCSPRLSPSPLYAAEVVDEPVSKRRSLLSTILIQDSSDSDGTDFVVIAQECHVIVDHAVRLGDTADVLSCDTIDELPHPNASSTTETVQSNRDPVIPDHDFNAQEYVHRFQFDNFRTQYRQYRRTPEYKLKLKQKEKKKKTIEKSLAAPNTTISKLVGVSRMTLYRRLNEGEVSVSRYANVCNDELDAVVTDILQEFPNSGYRRVQGYLQARGYIIQ
ncbi:unnamed protein product [Allacma fusca]|uniref:Uncharacterized protein n=1 Tax=Allacma fusca TaxID=39272 RepID=A0A8J2P657_9HEXA|nr:unnamed protein product [Allacma fusca]